MAESVDFDHVRIVMSLERFGEIVAHVAAAFAQAREIDPPDFDGQEMRDISISSWRHVVFMADREEFRRSVGADLDQLTAEIAPQHRSEFNL